MRLSDRSLVVALGVALFAVAAWPLALTRYPPLQDLPNHLASVAVLFHPEQYPDYITNPLFRSNSLTQAILFGLGHAMDLGSAARLLVVLTIAANAFAIPAVVVALRGRGPAVTATLVAWPVPHNWFVSMGMLNFAIAVPLSLALLLVVHSARHCLTPAKLTLASVLGLLVAWAHPTAACLVVLLVGLEVVRAAARARSSAPPRLACRPALRESLRLAIGILPTIVLTAALATGTTTSSLLREAGSTRFWALPDLIVNWHENYFHAFSRMTAVDVVPAVIVGCFLIGAFATRGDARPRPAIFSRPAILALGLLYAALPYSLGAGAFISARTLPYLAVAGLVWAPPRLPRVAAVALVALAIAYSAGLGADYVRLDREEREFLSAMPLVPDHAQLLSLVFARSGVSKNSHNLLHLSGWYAIERGAIDPQLFSSSRSFMLTRRQAARPAVAIASEASNFLTPAAMCGGWKALGAEAACVTAWRELWRAFWADARTRFDTILVWAAGDEFWSTVPGDDYTRVFEQGRLVLLRATAGAPASVAPAPR